MAGSCSSSSRKSISFDGSMTRTRPSLGGLGKTGKYLPISATKCQWRNHSEIRDQATTGDDADPERDRQQAGDARGQRRVDLGVPIAHRAERPAMKDARVEECRREQHELEPDRKSVG